MSGADKKQDGFDLKSGATDSEAVSGYYDGWAETYDETLRSWNYTAPLDAARLLAPHLKNGNTILDVGCGTGLFSIAAGRVGNFRITGIDISEESLKLAEENGDYERLKAVDLQELPLPFDDNAMDAAASVGVLTYIENAEALLQDTCRVVKTGGVIAFTQRTDRWEELGFRETIDRMTEQRLWSVLGISEPRPYLPGNPDFGDNIQVIHTLCRVC